MVRERRIETIHRQISTKPDTARFRYRELVTYDLTLSKGAKVLYNALDEQCRDVGSREVSQSTLTALTGIPGRSLKRYLAELRSGGFIESEKSFGGPNTYRMNWSTPVVETGPIDNGAKLSLRSLNGATLGPSMGPPLAPHIYQEDLKEKQIQTPPVIVSSTPRPTVVPQRRFSWEGDETFKEFSAAARQFWGEDLIEADLQSGWSFGWRKLDFFQQLEATKILHARIAAGEDPRYVKRLPKYLENGDWQRPPRPPIAAKPASPPNPAHIPFGPDPFAEWEK